MLPRPIATFDITARCPSRCAHCYFYRDTDSAAQADLDDEAFLAGVGHLAERYGIRSALWIGGEPLLRLDLLRRAMARFPRNAVVTSGLVPIPSDLDAGLLVSLDGPRRLHDALRGAGSFDRVVANAQRLPPGGFALSTTLTVGSLDTIEALPALVHLTGAMGALLGFAVATVDAVHRIEADARDRAVDRLQRLAATRPGVILNPPEALEWFRPARGPELARSCVYRSRAIAFDPQLREKRPCSFGAAASCLLCGCGAVTAQRAMADGSPASAELLGRLFPLASQGAHER